MMEQYPLILAIDTATRCSSVALTRGTLGYGEVVASLSLSSNITHSRRLIKSVDILFQETQTDWTDVEGIAVGLGPGSFTGLRIGMAAAKGFAAAAGKKLLGVPTLDCLAAMCKPEAKICAVMDARKKEVYTCFYWHNTSNGLKKIGSIRVISPEMLAAEIDAPVQLVGDGVALVLEALREEQKKFVTVAPAQLHAPTASAVGLLCGEHLQNNMFLDVASAAPLYVRASDAELSLIDTKKKAHPDK